MSWFINIDRVDNGDAVGQWNGHQSTLFKCKEACTYPFRLRDDDNAVYYEGKSTSDQSFQPLDDFGAPNAGCTDIQYRNKQGKWESL